MISKRIDFITGLFSEAMTLRSERDTALCMYSRKCMENDGLQLKLANRDVDVMVLEGDLADARAEIKRLEAQLAHLKG